MDSHEERDLERGRRREMHPISRSILKIRHYPPFPNAGSKLEFKSPKVGDLGDEQYSKALQTTCVYLGELVRGKNENGLEPSDSLALQNPCGAGTQDLTVIYERGLDTDSYT